MTNWKRKASLSAKIEAAGEDAGRTPDLLLAMADIVGTDDAEFADELREAAEIVKGLPDPVADADHWLSEFYDWADASRVWIA